VVEAGQGYIGYADRLWREAGDQGMAELALEISQLQMQV
jgi:hypothetical protein